VPRLLSDRGRKLGAPVERNEDWKEMREVKEARAASVEPGSIDELSRLFALSMKYQGAPQGALVHDLARAGLSVTRIAELLQTTPNTVSQAKRQPRPKWPPSK
jgi:hypothetical protein